MLGDISIAANVYIVTGYTDMRKLIDGLCAIVYDQLTSEPVGQSIYMFCGKRCDSIKVLFHESDGYVLLYKRLDVFKEDSVGRGINLKYAPSLGNSLTG